MQNSEADRGTIPAKTSQIKSNQTKSNRTKKSKKSRTKNHQIIPINKHTKSEPDCESKSNNTCTDYQKKSEKIK